MKELSNLVSHKDQPAQPLRPPLSCRLHLWHRWVRVHVDGQTSYVACERCQRLASRTIFDRPVP